MSEPLTAAPDRAEFEGLFHPTEYIHEYLPIGPKFGDDVWDFSSLTRMNQKDKRFAIGTIPGRYCVAARHLAMVRGRPMHPEIMAREIVIKATPAPQSLIISECGNLRVLAVWGWNRGKVSFAEWSQHDLDVLLNDLSAGRHRPRGKAMGASGINKYVALIKWLYSQRKVIPENFSFEPWPAQTAVKIAGLTFGIENETPPLAWDYWRTLIAAASAFVDKFSVDIIAADRAFRSAPKREKLYLGLNGAAGVQALRDYFNDGGHVPLHTGFGKSGTMARGTVNLAVLQRLTGTSPVLFIQRPNRPLPEARVLVDRALDQGKGVLGGFFIPQVIVGSVDGEDRPWIDEIGLGEAEFLPNLLRAAAYILIANMTGMRDSEIQALRSNCLGTEDGLTVLYSTQFKGRGPDGLARYWWAPDMLVRAVKVLADLSLNDELFARAPRSGATENPGAFMAPFFIDRFITFVNADPATRAGRGSGLALEKIVSVDDERSNALAFRRTFSVYAGTHPGAEIGLCITLGHASFRQTTSYASDGKQIAVHRLNDDRIRVVRDQVSRVLQPGRPLAGRAAGDILEVRAQMIADPARADKIREQAGENYHLGITNDCFYRSPQAACGTDGPKLASHFCASMRCANALVDEIHVPILQAQVERLDKLLDLPKAHASLKERAGEQRADLVAVIASLRADPAAAS